MERSTDFFRSNPKIASFERTIRHIYAVFSGAFR